MVRFSKFTTKKEIYKKFEEFFFKLSQREILFIAKIIEGVWFDDVGVEQRELG